MTIVGQRLTAPGYVRQVLSTRDHRLSLASCLQCYVDTYRLALQYKGQFTLSDATQLDGTVASVGRCELATVCRFAEDHQLRRRTLPPPTGSLPLD